LSGAGPAISGSGSGPNGPRIVVIGAGIVGAAVAHRLAVRGISRGARVTLIDRGAPGEGVTQRAFAWINISHGKPEPYSRLRHRALDDWRALERELAGGIAVDWCGALSWAHDPADTERFVQEHARCGYNVQLVDRGAIAAREPALRDPPPVAALAPGEGAVDPLAATRALVAAAQAAGAEIRSGLAATAIETNDAGITGVRTQTGTIDADIVVLAAGIGSAALAAPLGASLAVGRSPAILLRFASGRRLISTLLAGPDIEIRQPDASLLLAAEDYVDAGDANGPAAVAARAQATIRARIAGAEALALESVEVGWRPMPADDLPIVGFAPDVPGLYFSVMHAGVTLAPAVANLVAAEILGGADDAILTFCRPSRFAG